MHLMNSPKDQKPGDASNGLMPRSMARGRKRCSDLTTPSSDRTRKKTRSSRKRKRPCTSPPSSTTPSVIASTEIEAAPMRFYDSPEWRRLRFQTLQKYGRRCMACGETPPKVVIHVDHIKPLASRPDLALEPSNLQVLCMDCNLGKANLSQADFRPSGRSHGERFLPYADKRRELKVALVQAEHAGEWDEVNRLLRVYQTLSAPSA